MIRPLACLLLLACAGSSAGAVESVDRDWTYDSVYTHYIIRRRGTVVELRHSQRNRQWLESAVDLADPRRQVVRYTRTVYASLAFHDAPARVLMIGLGGGGFNRLFNAAFPEALLRTVEIDALALELARKHMAFAEGPRNEVVIMDGRRYLRRDDGTWDWIILDAFHGGSVPFHLKTAEFYALCRERLAPDGLLISNLHSTTRLYDADVRTLKHAFPQLMLFQVPERGNVIAVAANYASPSMESRLAAYDPATAPEILREYVDVGAEVARHRDVRQSAPDGRILTDDFAPAEHLNVQPRD